MECGIVFIKEADATHGTDNKVAVGYCVNRMDLGERKRRCVFVIESELFEAMAVKPVQSIAGADPQESEFVLRHASDIRLRKPVVYRNPLNQDLMLGKNVARQDNQKYGCQAKNRTGLSQGQNHKY